jgi:hypothetical protein
MRRKLVKIVSGYSDSKGTHIRAGNNDKICGFCQHGLNKHYFLNHSRFAYCTNGNIFTKCDCKLLEKHGWEPLPKKLREVVFSA